jgi:hypothetical protein
MTQRRASCSLAIFDLRIGVTWQAGSLACGLPYFAFDWCE